MSSVPLSLLLFLTRACRAGHRTRHTMGRELMALASLPGTVYRENPQKPQKALPPVSLQPPLPLFHNRKPTQTENSSRRVTLTDGSYDLVFFPHQPAFGLCGYAAHYARAKRAGDRAVLFPSPLHNSQTNISIWCSQRAFKLQRTPLLSTGASCSAPALLARKSRG